MGRKEPVTQRISDKRQIRRTIALFAAAYLVSYITRINYGAVIAEMMQQTGMDKASLSAALTGSFITYGAGQLISGWFGDRIQPKRLVLGGLLTTAAMNLALPFCRTPPQMTAVWCVNGLAQAFLWPPLVKLMTTLFSQSDYRRASVVVSLGSSLGTILVYLLSPLCIAWAGWRSIFWLCSLCALAMAAVWQQSCRLIPMEPPQPAEVPTASAAERSHRPLLLFILLCIVIQGALRDGVTTWMPSYISETYQLSTGVSILTGVVMPVFSMIAFQAASLCYRKTPSNPLQCALFFFSAGTVFALLLALLFSHSPLLSVLLSALLCGCMHGVNLMLVCMVPPFFQRQGNVSAVSGLLNACTYIGSAVSTYGIALTSEALGWQATILTWLGLAAAGSLICLTCIPAWKRRFG